ncbi:hypothetical protein [Aeromonas enteropelogenes]|uniref:hypothetical protein n=1 Tax=Aeromonas enteropelogenes TaxID=29489 RepID=UPI0038CF4FC3
MKIFRAEPLLHYYHNDVHLGFIDRLLVKFKRDRPDFNRRMFHEDFSMLFNSMKGTNSNLFNVESNDHRLMQVLLGNVQTRYATNSVDESILQLAEEIAKYLIWFGKAYFFLRENTEKNEINMVSFSSSGVVRLFGTHIQIVPKRSASHWDKNEGKLPREIRILDAAKIMRFDMPTQIQHMLSAQNRTLAILDKHQLGEVNLHSKSTYEDPNPTNHFDFRVWKDIQDRALYRATRRTGWNGRNGGSTNRSDFFDCHRFIRFRRNQLLLRDDILNQLGSELSRVGKSYKAEFSVKISATNELPNVSHLNELEVKLAHEKVGFKEIIGYCLKS